MQALGPKGTFLQLKLLVAGFCTDARCGEQVCIARSHLSRVVYAEVIQVHYGDDLVREKIIEAVVV